MKITKQGIRDLGGNARVRMRVLSRCPHIWASEWRHDCWLGYRYLVDRCELCHAERAA